MKKQFNRVKQFADLTFLRLDKTVLNQDELKIAVQKVDYLSKSIQAITKKLPASGANQNVENCEKRMKKYIEYQLGQILLELSTRRHELEQTNRPEEECQLFQYIVQECGKAEQDLARELAEHDYKVEQMVSAPLQKIIDTDLPNIAKQKRNLQKLISDKNSANSRYNATKNENHKEALKDDLDEADNKLELGTDSLAVEMFSLLRKENELSQYLLQLLKLQRACHESALKNLEKIIPELEKKIGDSQVKPMFGISLDQHLQVTGKRIAYPLELCICALKELGMTEEGLFRVAGGTSRVKRLKCSIDSGCFKCPLLPEYRDVHVIASTLKSYLRELPEPLLTYSLYNEWMGSMRYPDEEQRVKAVQEILKKLPQSNKDNLTYLIQFFDKLTKHPENKMNSSNIAIVIAPNLLWKKDETQNLHMANCATMNLIVELFINKADILFPDNVSQYVTVTKEKLFASKERDDEEFLRPKLSNVKLNEFEPHAETVHSEVATQESPKPNIRRKTKPAPVPPAATTYKTEAEITIERSQVPASYPSGSSTLNRVHKSKDTPVKTKVSQGVNTDESTLSPTRRKSITTLEDDNIDTHTNKSNELPKAANLVNVEDKTVEHKYVLQPAANVQISKAKPVQQIIAQNMYVDKINQKTVNHQTVDSNLNSKPKAAPRSINNDSEKHAVVTRSSSMRGENVMSKSLNSIDISSDVQLRKPVPEDSTNRPAKPEIPMRPASLRAVPKSSLETNVDPSTLHRTQCSVYSVAYKQQPSIVNIQSKERHQPGHDSQIAEKEKFLGHHHEKVPTPRMSLENKFNDINSNCSEKNRSRTSSIGNANKPELPPKLASMKSNEKINVDSNEKVNGNKRPSHVRTKSDGNIIELSSENQSNATSLLKTPPSPRSCNKPTQPPPPPPVNANVNKTKSESDSTDL